MSVELLTHFSQNFSRYFDSTDESNLNVLILTLDYQVNGQRKKVIILFLTNQILNPKFFEIVLKYLYTGIITSIESQSPSFVIQLLCAADELILPEMISYVEDQFLLHHSSYLNENFSEILNIAFKHFESLKERLKNCIPYIRFSDISPEDFFVRIRPLKKIFPDDVYEEVFMEICYPKNVIFVNKREKETQQEETLNFNARNNDKESSFPYLINYRNSLQPSRPSPIDSSIINLKHAALISSWVDRLSHPYRLASIPYQFRLLLRSTRDGFTAAEFHKKCDSFDKTVTVLRVKGTKEIFGGYNPLNWNGSGYKSTSESFIFSFEVTPNCGPQWGGNDLRAWGVLTRIVVNVFILDMKKLLEIIPIYSQPKNLKFFN
ncbi:unnamed protein product [Rhizophagus irregularis]|nr:unnamed protein product [Rhizophagus irregularis]